jgi:dienelactone hydrolase
VQDARRSALPTDPPAAENTQTWLFGQIGKVASPVLALWNAAQKDPNSREARIVTQVAAIGGFDRDAASIAFPLVTAALGADDMTATAGGQVHGNIGKVYASPAITAEEAAALNAGVQRFPADRAAQAYLQRWHEASGRIRAPLVTLHNSVDSLVPYAQEQALAAEVTKAGRSANLVQYSVPPVRAPLPVGGVEGYTHCGFDKAQTLASWNALRGWVEKGRRPAADAVK